MIEPMTITPDKRDVTPLKESFGFVLNVAGRQMKRLLEQRLAEHGLTGTQYVTLWALWESSEALPLTQLSKRLCIDNPTMSGIVDRMARDGFVERVQDTNDRRVTYIRPTPKGIELWEAIGGIGGEIDRATACNVDQALFAQFMNFLRRITRNDHEDK